MNLVNKVDSAGDTDDTLADAMVVVISGNPLVNILRSVDILSVVKFSIEDIFYLLKNEYLIQEKTVGKTSRKVFIKLRNLQRSLWL